jgi:YVTN family beta-propeller protein
MRRTGIVIRNTAVAVAAGLFGALTAVHPAAADPAGTAGLVYVPTYNDNSVAVVDPARHAVVARIPSGGLHPIVMRRLGDGSKLYVDNFGLTDNNIGVIGARSRRLVKTIKTTGTPYASMALSRDSRYLYVPTDLSVVHVIDTATDTIVHTFPIFGLPIDIEVAPDGAAFYAFSNVGTAQKFDARTGGALTPPLFITGLVPGWAALSADGRTLYGINYVSSNITVIDTAQWRVRATIQLPLDSFPLSGTLTPDGKQLWIANPTSKNITIIDTATATVARVVPQRTAVSYVGFAPDGRTAYLSDIGTLANAPRTSDLLGILSTLYAQPPGGDGSLRIVDTATFRDIDRIGLNATPVAGVYPG